MAAGVIAGAVAAAAALGAAITMGSRLGDAMAPLNATAAYVLGSGAQSLRGFHLATTISGIVVHTAVLIAVGVAVRAIRLHWGIAIWLASVLTSSALLAVSLASARFSGLGLAALLPLGDLLVLHALIVVALVVGMRLAFSAFGAGRSGEEM